MRGRPPVTRERVLAYIEANDPDTLMQVVRETGADRRHVQRIVRAAEKMLGEPIFAAYAAIPLCCKSVPLWRGLK